MVVRSGVGHRADFDGRMVWGKEPTMMWMDGWLVGCINGAAAVGLGLGDWLSVGRKGLFYFMSIVR